MNAQKHKDFGNAVISFIMFLPVNTMNFGALMK